MLRPLLKWAGGKRWLVSFLIGTLPVKWAHYYEPFAGAAALLVEMWNRRLLGGATISDTNEELVNLYVVVRDCPQELVSALKQLPFGNDPKSYYAARDRFNEIRGGPAKVERAALLIYLNRHCYNGLWRVNAKGEFNVPFGRYNRPSMPSEEDVFGFHALLRNVRILNVDFEEAVKDVSKGDLVYLDPPYQPASETASFTDYTPEGFTKQDQVRLAKVFRELDERGAYLILSNSDTELVRSLYEGYYVETVEANRAINSKTERRRGAREIIVTNYEVEKRRRAKLNSGWGIL
ncbi:site-specific DNA-methyltransferase (adenine-specific) [Sulfodiicoccus acidiphilus]|uniref:site-specific DNA-methyltransferase (adenine-specific) n=1 Tax=Sulfodiicoccus acidiphilus TaxID=1670455 RepID=A0A348B4V1_9CREN|nr:DNA adenine methylase [Sulfodiicoccus acidiphilus]BBD73203.1 site-specific DNA-methyltransferase (adenine-specific) [Sulfodiicoccus acidiphilus]GGU01466.1 site-specific DNA-methyltransferase (adenine-specific) [Sulfodiicoccus acidiphilus]